MTRLEGRSKPFEPRSLAAQGHQLRAPEATVRFPDDDRVLRSNAMTLSNIVARNLRAVQAEQKLSQQVVAKKATVSVSYISML